MKKSLTNFLLILEVDMIISQCYRRDISFFLLKNSEGNPWVGLNALVVGLQGQLHLLIWLLASVMAGTNEQSSLLMSAYW